SLSRPSRIFRACCRAAARFNAQLYRAGQRQEKAPYPRLRPVPYRCFACPRNKLAGRNGGARRRNPGRRFPQRRFAGDYRSRQDRSPGFRRRRDGCGHRRGRSPQSASMPNRGAGALRCPPYDRSVLRGLRENRPPSRSSPGRGRMIDTVVMRSISELAVEQAWWLLWERCARRTPFQSPGWLLPWYRAFRPGEPVAFAFWDAGRLVGIAPFYAKRETDGCHLQPFGTAVSDFLDILVEPGSEDLVVEAFAAALAAETGWNTV